MKTAKPNVRGGHLLKVDVVNRAIMKAMTPEEIIDVEAKIEAMETYLRKSGIDAVEKVRPWNEARMRARWRLGQLLSTELRSAGPGRGKKNAGAPQSFVQLLKRIGFKAHKDAYEAQQIGTMPQDELNRVFAENAAYGSLNTFAELRRRAAPWWKAQSRKRRHQAIQEAAVISATPGQVGPFALIYADPPWKYEFYSDEHHSRGPDEHYPVMEDQAIKDLSVFGKSVLQIAAEHAVLFMWCTSSNLERALSVLPFWGFEYKTHLVWDKVHLGLGLIFRNQHELLLYGSRGEPPGPVKVPPSVFREQRGEHSVKPTAIRDMLEKMYPAFDESTRIELFARGRVPGWSAWGYESKRAA